MKPHIAFISEHASPLALLGSQDAGGQNVYVDEVSRNLGLLGYNVDIITRCDALELPEVVQWAPGVRIVNLRVGPRRFVPKDHLWPLMPDFRQELLKFMVRTNTRYDLAHGNFWMSGWVACQLGQGLFLPTVQIFHAMGKTKQHYQGQADSSPAERVAVEMEVVRQADQLIAQCPSERDELIERYAATPEKVVVIPSAVNSTIFRPVPRSEARARIGLDGDELTVVYVGRMLPRKDVRNLVRAVAMLIHQLDLPVRLLLVGGETTEPDPQATPEIGVLQELAAELDIADRIIFYGKRQPELLRYFYCAGDVAVTTPWYEPFGLTPLEAQACGRPVIGSAVGGITYTIQDGVTGLLVPPRDPESLALALQRLLKQPEQRRLMGLAARAYVEREFTWATVARRTAELYERLFERDMPGLKERHYGTG